MQRVGWAVTAAAAALLLAGCASDVERGGIPSASTGAVSQTPGPLLLGPVGLAEVDGTAWVAWSGNGVVTPLAADGTPGEPVAVGDTPLRMAALDGALWVTTIADGRLTEVDVATGTVGRSVDVGDEPEGVVAFGGHLFVVLQGESSLAEVDPDSGEVVERYDVGGAPRLVAAGPDALFVTDFEGGHVVRVTPGTGEVAVAKTRCPQAQDVLYLDGIVYATCMGTGVVVGIDAESLATVVKVPMPGDPDSLTAGPGGSLLVGLQEGPAVVSLDPATRSVSPVFDATAGNLRDRSNVDVLVLGSSVLVSDAIDDVVHVLGLTG